MKTWSKQGIDYEHDWYSNSPGYVAWKGQIIEHYGPMGEDWPGKNNQKAYKELCKLRNICEHLEKLGIVPSVLHVVSYRDWWMEIDRPEQMFYFEYFKHGLAEFYVDQEGRPAFTKQTEIDEEGSWIINFDLAIWYGDNWVVQHDVAKCPDVVYHRMIEKGFKHGSDVFYTQNILPPNVSIEQIEKYFKLWRVPKTCILFEEVTDGN